MHNLVKLVVLLIILSFPVVSYGVGNNTIIEESPNSLNQSKNSLIGDADLATDSLVLLKGDKEEIEPSDKSEKPANTTATNNSGVVSISKVLPKKTPIIITKPIDVESLTGEDIYNGAFSLYKRGRYEESIRLFIKFIKAYPRHEFVDNSIYWIGRNYYGMGDYKTARAIFYRVIRDYPNEDKAPSAYLGIIACENSLGDRDGAVKAFKMLKEKYPNSIEVKQAKKGKHTYF